MEDEEDNAVPMGAPDLSRAFTAQYPISVSVVSGTQVQVQVTERTSVLMIKEQAAAQLEDPSVVDLGLYYQSTLLGNDVIMQQVNCFPGADMYLE